MDAKPALLGGIPAFETPLPFASPTREDGYGAAVLESMAGSLESGIFTDGPMVRRLEEGVAAEFGVEHCVAVSSATIGLMLVLQALGIDGPVLIPSFTFSATAHAARWNGLDILFADCDRRTWCLGVEHLRNAPKAIIGVHVSGVPCDVVALQAAAADLGARLIFDAAHGAGSLVEVDGRPTTLGGFGTAEVFSLTPTKVMSGAEGGLITTNDSALAEHLRVARNYGNPGDYDTLFPGLNARLSEPHAALALASLARLESRVKARNELADLYREGLAAVPGIGFQEPPPGSRSSMKDFTITVDAASFGASRDAVNAALHAEGIATRLYYSPPVHQQTAYRDVESPPLPVTEWLGGAVITLPMWSHLPVEHAEQVVAALAQIQRFADDIEAAVASSTIPATDGSHLA